MYASLSLSLSLSLSAAPRPVLDVLRSRRSPNARRCPPSCAAVEPRSAGLLTTARRRPALPSPLLPRLGASPPPATPTTPGTNGPASFSLDLFSQQTAPLLPRLGDSPPPATPTTPETNGASLYLSARNERCGLSSRPFSPRLFLSRSLFGTDGTGFPRALPECPIRPFAASKPRIFPHPTTLMLCGGYCTSSSSSTAAHSLARWPSGTPLQAFFDRGTINSRGRHHRRLLLSQFFRCGPSSMFLPLLLYCHLCEQYCHLEYIANRAIMATKNEFVDNLNEMIIKRFPGEERIYHSFDCTVDEANSNYQLEFLNSLTPNGMPPSKLMLKKCCPVILLRNLDPTNGLCNGTRLLCIDLQKNIIKAKIAVGQHCGKEVLIPRIPLYPAEVDKYPFNFRRKQFPTRLAFAMTINKAQGQTIPNVGIYLSEPVFSHGQLYVAMSRGISKHTTKFLIKRTSVYDGNDCRYTRNIVWSEIYDTVPPTEQNNNP